MNPSEENEAWERRFERLKQLEPARPRPFFYTRLEARLRARLEDAGAPVLPWWLRRPSYALAILGLLAVLNLAAALSSFGRTDTAEANPYTFEGFLSEYQLDQQSIYADE